MEKAEFFEVQRLAADETSKARGHDYISLVADVDQRRVLFATQGHDGATIKAFAQDLTAHGSDPEAIESVCIDMSPLLSAVSPSTCPTLRSPSTMAGFDKDIIGEATPMSGLRNGYLPQ